MPTSPRRASLTLDERIAVIAALSSFLRDGVLKRGAVKATAEQFRCHRHTIQAVWKRRLESSDTAINLAFRMTKTVEASQALARRDHRGDRAGVARCRSNAPQDDVGAVSQEQRHPQVQQSSGTISDPSEQEAAIMYDRGVVDEKWFYLTKVKKRFYLTANEDDVPHTVKSEHYVPKIMFIAAVTRPRYDTTRARWFSGKLGIWSFIVKEPAERASKNCPAGTMVTKAVNVTKEVYRQALLTHVFPAIKEQWLSKKTPIVVQQDNARPHVSPMDAAIVATGESGGWDIGLQFQPPNSPDFNILDLGFFNSIQAIQHQHQPKNLDELIACVSEAFEQLHHETLDNVFLTMQCVMQELLKNHGGNQFRIPRMSKAKKRKADILADAISCDRAVYETASAF